MQGTGIDAVSDEGLDPRALFAQVAFEGYIDVTVILGVPAAVLAWLVSAAHRRRPSCSSPC